MFARDGLEKRFWSEVVPTTCYLINTSPTSSILNKTPMEVRMVTNPSLQHIHVFGYQAYGHVVKEKWLNLYIKVMKCIFIGYGIGLKGYKIWDPIIVKVLYRGNFTFREVNPSPIVVQLEEDDKRSIYNYHPRYWKLN